MFKKILIASGTILGTTGPIIATLACEPKATISSKATIKLKADKLYFLDLQIQASNSRQRFTMEEFIKKADLSKLPDFNSFYKSKMLVGGFGEARSFYSGTIKTRKPWSFYHLGYDVMVPQNTIIKAPANGDILAAWWKSPTQAIIAQGVGGEVLMRIKIADLKVQAQLKEMLYVKKIAIRKGKKVISWVASMPKLLFAQAGKYQGINAETDMELATHDEYDTFLNSSKGKPYQGIAHKASQYIYIFFMHLSKQTPNLLDQTTKETRFRHKTKTKDVTYRLRMAPNIDIDTPLKVKQGQIIGYVGDSTDNGGWPHHVHIETYAFAPFASNRIARVYGSPPTRKGYRIANKLVSSEDFKKIFINARAVGSYQKSGVDRSKKTFRNWYISRLQAIDPNQIFDLYDSKTPIKKVII